MNDSEMDEKSSREPVYIPDGEEFGEDFSSGSKRPKWTMPKGTIQKLILDAVGRQYYQTRNERSAVVAIDKATMYLNSGIISVYPTEWVETCVEWAKRKRHERMPISLLGLINLINNNDRKQQFIQKWSKEHSDVVLRKGEVPSIEEPIVDPQPISRFTEEIKDTPAPEY